VTFNGDVKPEKRILTYDKKEYKVSGRNKVSKRKRRYLWDQRSVQYVMEK
jgi:hypothetical protein